MSNEQKVTEVQAPPHGEWEITVPPEGEKTWLAQLPLGLTVTVGEGGRMCKKNFVKGFGGPKPERIQWLLAELDGVRVYFDGMRVHITKQELAP